MRTLQQITAVGVVLAGLVFLYHALADVVPLVFSGTPEEFAAREAGRRLVIVAVLALVATGAALALARRRLSGTLAAATGIATAALAYGFPEAAYVWLAFLALGLAATPAVLAGP